MFDLTRRSSFASLPNWKSEVSKVIGEKPSILVGNKIDLAGEGHREVGQQDGEALKTELKAISYFETSAKDGVKIEEMFTETVLEILKTSNKI